MAVKDLQENIRISNSSIISGVLKYLPEYKGFSGNKEQQQGNFLALSFESEDAEKIETKVINGDNAGYVDLTEDKYCVYRIKDSATQKIEVKLTKEGKTETKTYSLTGLTCNPCPVGEAAFDTEKTDYGRFGKTTDFYDGVSISWSGTKATVTGTLKFLKKSDHSEYSSLKSDGNYFAYALKPWFKGKDITFEGNNTKTSQETDWIISVDEKNKAKGITVKYGSTVIATFDLTGLTLQQNSEAV